MAFTLLKIEKVREEDLDTAIKSDSANGLVKTRLPYTKIRKKFTLTIPVSKKDERDEVKGLYEANRTVLPFVFTNPDDGQDYTVRFAEKVITELDATLANHYNIDNIILEEV